MYVFASCVAVFFFLSCNRNRSVLEMQSNLILLLEYIKHENASKNKMNTKREKKMKREIYKLKWDGRPAAITMAMPITGFFNTLYEKKSVDNIFFFFGISYMVVKTIIHMHAYMHWYARAVRVRYVLCSQFVIVRFFECAHCICCCCFSFALASCTSAVFYASVEHLLKSQE